MRKLNLYLLIILVSAIYFISSCVNKEITSAPPVENKTTPPTEVTSVPPKTDYPAEEALIEVFIPDDYFKVPVYQYESTKYSFTVSYPQTWTIKENIYQEDIGGYGVQFTSERSLVDISIVAGNINGTLEEITKNYATNTEKNSPSWMVSRYSTSIKDPETYMIQIDGQIPWKDTMIDFRNTSVWFFQDNTLYFVKYEAFGPLCRSREYLACLYSMLHSFKFTTN